MISKANRLLISILDHLPRIIPCAVQYSQGILCSVLVCTCVCGIFAHYLSVPLRPSVLLSVSLCFGVSAGVDGGSRFGSAAAA